MLRFALLSLSLALGGCVQRTIRITSDPPGAQVFLDGDPAGVTPAEIPFTWYGDREFVLERAGHLSVRAVENVPAPWWQIFPFDFLLDMLIPLPLRDSHEFHYTMEPVRPGPESYEETKRRAEEFRRKAHEGD